MFLNGRQYKLKIVYPRLPVFFRESVELARTEMKKTKEYFISEAKTGSSAALVRCCITALL
jgi:hypothetical protein